MAIASTLSALRSERGGEEANPNKSKLASQELFAAENCPRAFKK